jgi:hypothetical protein
MRSTFFVALCQFWETRENWGENEKQTVNTLKYGSDVNVVVFSSPFLLLRRDMVKGGRRSLLL